MTTSRASTLLGAAIALAAMLGGAHEAAAADLGLKDSYAPPPPQRTWYIKGTIGMHNQEVGDIWTPGYEQNTFTVLHKDMKSTPFYGLGIGLDHGRWLRFDVTGEYRGKFLFLAQDIYPGGSGFGAGSNEYTADIESWMGLFNAYIDIGTWCGITPYVGAGVGLVSLSVQGLKDVNAPQSTVYYGGDNTDVNFAWALYAGMSYDVTDRFTLDLAYRYADLGDAKSGVVRDYAGNNPYNGVFIQDITSHDLMFSARFALDRREPVPVAIK